MWRVYDYITRHFIASLSPPCKFVTTKARFTVGGEDFSYSGTRVTSPGFTVILTNHVTLDAEEQERENRQVPDMTSAGAWTVQAIDLKVLISLCCFCLRFTPCVLTPYRQARRQLRTTSVRQSSSG